MAVEDEPDKHRRASAHSICTGNTDLPVKTVWKSVPFDVGMARRQPFETTVTRPPHRNNVSPALRSMTGCRAW